MRMSSTTMKIWDIRGTTSTLGLDAFHIMQFVHAISECDTTSQMLRMDHPLFKRFKNEIRLREHAMMFMNPNALQDEIVKSGEEII